jgi:ribosomal protein S18 acetylase RimI-like enzyme
VELGVTVQLRSASATDAALVADMHSRSRESAYRGMLSDHYLDHQAKAEALALWPAKLQELAAGAGELLIAERDHVAVGFICMLKPDAQGSVYIDNLHAMPEHQGSGAGTAMLDEARRWALSFGATRLHLLVLDTNRAAIGFYESRGWQLVGRKNDTMGGSDVVALVYALGLDPTLPLGHS